jgi:pimeloyl-ACP methyl ester carboxylesterase
VWAEKIRVPTRAGEIAVVDRGDPEAPPVVLLSGGFTSSFVWRTVIPMLSPFLRVIAPDLLGSGDSASPPGADLSLSGHARSIRDVLERLGVERFALGGHGHGGGVAQLLALEGGVQALLLVDTIAFDAWPEEGIRDLLERDDRGRDDMLALLRATFATMTARQELPADAMDEYLRPFAGEEGLERFARVARSFDGAGLVGIERRLGELDVPALVVWGEEDALLDPALAERLGDALPRAAVALLPGCGHLVLEDAPETVAPLVFQWLRSQYLGIEHRHDAGPVAVPLGRRPVGEER